MEGYKATLRDGRDIYIPNWPVDVALENLTKAGKYLGTDNIIEIAYINIPAVIVAIMGAEDPKQCAALVRHFICQVRIDGSKIDATSIDEMFSGNLGHIAELFAHVVHSQYHDFFESGLVKEPSQDS